MTAAGACSRGAARDAGDRAEPAPQRVVTLAPNVTEIVNWLGAGGRIVATDDASDHPPAMRTLPKVGSGLAPSVERIVAARPDLVIASASVDPQRISNPLQAAGVLLLVVRTDRLDDILRAVTTIGSQLGVADADERAAALRREITKMRRPAEPSRRTLYVVSADPLFVAGRQTYVDDLYEVAGLTNAVPPTVTGWPQYSIEALYDDPPEIVLYPRRALGGGVVERLFARVPGRERIAFHAVDDDPFSRPGPRVIDALQTLRAIAVSAR